MDSWSRFYLATDNHLIYGVVSTAVLQDSVVCMYGVEEIHACTGRTSHPTQPIQATYMDRETTKYDE